MKISKLRIGALAALLALLFTGLGAGAALALQNHMYAAKHSLDSALSELKRAPADKGGHRDNAINDVESAINEVSLGIQAAK